MSTVLLVARSGSILAIFPKKPEIICGLDAAVSWPFQPGSKAFPRHFHFEDALASSGALDNGPTSLLSLARCGGGWCCRASDRGFVMKELVH
jgi:hypothetical protein